MSYISFGFYVFFLFFVLYSLLVPARHRWKVFLTFSIVFYAYAGIGKLLMVILSSLFVYLFARLMGRQYEKYEQEIREKELPSRERMALLSEYKKKTKRLVVIALAGMIGVLVLCKTYSKILGLWEAVTGAELLLTIIVPLGISYYTFSSVGYLLDVYWRKTKPEKNYGKLLLCMIYFPQIVEGPISRYDKLLPQFENPKKISWQRFCNGLQFMIWGYFKKMVIADRLSVVVTTVLGDPGSYEGFVILIAMIFSAFHIYADFSGCMDIVTGASYIVGVDLDPNFNHPFFSRSVAEFWRRWHITLGTWFKDYVYMPIATSPTMMKISKKLKKGFGIKAAKNFSFVIPTAVVWLLTGLWHNASFNYLLWGIYYGTLITGSQLLTPWFAKMAKLFHIKTEGASWHVFQMVRTFCVFMVGRLITVPGTLQGTWIAIRQLFSACNVWVFFDETFYSLGLGRTEFHIALAGALLLLLVDALQEKCCLREKIADRNIVLRWTIYFAAFFLVLILGMYGSEYSTGSFIYAGF
ncbi:MAG: hypothetical protein LUH53_03605 [Lachnospiraceae bacterium]|nr:hypothetical protein [Lachnospiraceae bacterium]